MLIYKKPSGKGNSIINQCYEYLINARNLLIQTGKAKGYSLSFGGTGKSPMTEWLAMTGRAGINAWQCMYIGEGVRNGNLAPKTAYHQPQKPPAKTQLNRRFRMVSPHPKK